jgi:hypothetical protein
MPVDRNAPVRISAFDWVPPFAQGYVRDLRPRCALGTQDTVVLLCPTVQSYKRLEFHSLPTVSAPAHPSPACNTPGQIG